LISSGKENNYLDDATVGGLPHFGACDVRYWPKADMTIALKCLLLTQGAGLIISSTFVQQLL